MAPSLDEIERMRAASGTVRSQDRLVGFLYLLARDELAVGKIEDLVDQVADHAPPATVFTNGWLASWAIDAAARLRPDADD